MPAYASVKVFGADIAALHMRRGAERAANFSTVFDDIMADLMRVIRINFESQGRRGGGSWKVLDEGYIRRKLRMGEDPRILIASEALLDSWTVWGDEEQDLQISTHEASLSSNLPYARVQAEGSEKMNIPARPYTRVLPSDRDHWMELLTGHMMEVMRG